MPRVLEGLLDVDTVAATNGTSGVISLSDTDGLTVNVVTNAGSDVSITAAGAIVLGNDVTTSNLVTLISGGTITGAAGAQITAAAANLSAVGGITLLGTNSLVVGSITASNTTSGNISLDFSGAVSVIGTGVSNTAGDINLTSVGTLIYSKIGAVQYPQGAASAVLLVVVLMIGVWVITRLSNLREDL